MLSDNIAHDVPGDIVQAVMGYGLARFLSGQANPPGVARIDDRHQIEAVAALDDLLATIADHLAGIAPERSG